MKIIYNIGKVFVLIFFVIGVFTFMVSIHELKHFYDVKNDAEVTEICVMNLPTNFPPEKDWTFGHVHSFPYGKKPYSSEFMAGLTGLIPFTIILFIGFHFIFLSEKINWRRE